MATFSETEKETTSRFVVVPAPDDFLDPHAAALAAKMEECRRNMLDYTERMTSLGLIPSRPPRKRWFPRLTRLWRHLLVRINPNFIRIRPNQIMDLEDIDILQRQGMPGCLEQLAMDQQLVKDCLDHYNRQNPGNEYEPVLGIVSTRNYHFHNGICWTHGNFVAQKKGSGVFSFLTAPRSVFFYERAYIKDSSQVVTCTAVEELAYGVLGYPLWCYTRTSGKLDSFCKTCRLRFGIPRPGVQKFACEHNNMVEVCEMCYCRSDALHPNPGEFAFGYHHPYRPYATEH